MSPGGRTTSTHHASPSFTRTFAGLMRGASVDPSATGSGRSCRSFSSMLRFIASTAAGDRSFAMTCLVRGSTARGQHHASGARSAAADFTWGISLA